MTNHGHPVVYVAGPYRGPNAWVVECNIRHAEQIGSIVANNGGIPLIPHTMYRFWNGTLTDEFWLFGTTELLKRCDGIVLLHTWMDSEGSKGERRVAEARDMPILELTAHENSDRLISSWLRRYWGTERFSR